jgi:hypothetical protein
MFSSEPFRAKAAEYLELAAKAHSPNEVLKFIGTWNAATPC